MKTGAREFSCHEISKALYLSPEGIQGGLTHFEKIGLIKAMDGNPKTYLYHPANYELREAAEQALKAYNERRVQVVSLIFSGPIQTFSDAFRLRREDE